ncbi:hypothetical protein [Alicyclobacillus dauci]|uniref:Uncharacterized protein n=1 Tax=Alicyclobacillus dauci TaxID=1475485 RepID=A0ABY6Z0D3_9BACL|nr:hypothetical protein [Alicyclobacillus dauci]WAH35420.1 hypothetical protein NZD86_14055 [Alicyclobacillus dauci]
MFKSPQSVRNASGYAKTCGLLALMLSILAVLMPSTGVLAVIPVAILLGAFALYNGYRTLGIGIVVMCAVNLVISPTFWANVDINTIGHTELDRMIAYFDAVGTLAMCGLMFKRD